MKAGPDLPMFGLSCTGQDAFGALHLIDQPDPSAGVGLYGGAVIAAFKKIFASRRIVHFDSSCFYFMSHLSRVEVVLVDDGSELVSLPMTLEYHTKEMP